MLLHANPEDLILTASNKPFQRLKSEEFQYQKLFQSSLVLFQKPYEHRTTNELSLISKIVSKIQFFKALEKYTSSETVKSVLKYGKIVKLNDSKLIYQSDSYLDYFVIALTGKYGIINSNLEETMFFQEEQSYQDYIQNFKNFTSQYLQLLKRKQHRQPKTFKPPKISIRQVEIKKQILANLDNQIVFTNKNIFSNKTQVKRVNQSIVTLGQSNYVFEIEFKKLCEILRDQYNKGILKQMEIFLTFNCFKLFKKEKLKRMVEDLEVIKLKKGHILFSEGQEDKRIFILIKGEVVLERTVCLGQQNPNNLYMNRLSIKRSELKSRVRDQISVIPFADFTKVYNSSSELKKVKLSRVSPVSILGEEEVISQNPRQTTAKVASLSAELYGFTVEQISKYFTSDSQFKVEDFLHSLSKQITQKKILYRQQKLGGEVEYLNKNSQNGFYISKNQSKTSRTKKTISNFYKTIPIKSQSKINKEDSDNQMFLTASFNCHNFEQFYESKKQIKIEKEMKKEIKSFPDACEEKSKIVQLSVQEKEILKLLHGNQRTVIKTPKSFKTKSENRSVSFAIDLDKPLFTPEYFKQQIQKSRKIDNEMKKSRLKNLYNSNLSLINPKPKTLSTSFTKNKAETTISGFRRNLSYQI